MAALRQAAFAILVVIAGSAGTALAAETGISRPAPFHYRMILEEDFLWTDKAGVDRLVQSARAGGFNVIVPCVWHGRGVTWRSGLPREPAWEKQRGALPDPLGYLITEAHRNGIEVHPWFTVVLRQRDFFRTYWDDGSPDQAFDIHRPAFREFIASVVREVAQNYPVDGINLDYVRSRGVCSSASCQKDYAAFSGRNLTVDAATSRVSSAAWDAIAAWNARSMDATIDRIAEEVRRARPDVPISVSSHAGWKGFQFEGANSIRWLNDGKIDLILHMEYARVGKMRTELLDIAFREIREPWRLIFLAGNYERSPLNRSDVSAREASQVALALRFGMEATPGSAGIALYSYRFLTPEQLALLPAILASPAR